MSWMFRSRRKIGTDAEDIVTQVVVTFTSEGHKFPTLITSHRIAIFNSHLDETTECDLHWRTRLQTQVSESMTFNAAF